MALTQPKWTFDDDDGDEEDEETPYGLFSRRGIRLHRGYSDYLVVHDQGRAVAAVAVAYDRNDASAEVSVAVAEGYERKGLAKRLLVEALKKIKSEEPPVTVVYADVVNEQAMPPLLKSLGFEQSRGAGRQWKLDLSSRHALMSSITALSARLAISAGKGVVTLPKGSKLFHGTGEKFSGGLKVGGYDKIAWFADCAAIAQLYIPISGTSLLIRPSELVRPSKDASTQIVQRAIGIDYDMSKVEWRHNGWELQSFPLPKGWKELPSPLEIMRRLDNAGYKHDQYGVYEIRRDGNRLMKPDEKSLGRLFVGTTKRDMRLWLKARGEGDLTDVQYHDVRGFRDAEKAGLDGVLIDDFAQSKGQGNFGHLSVGLFAKTLKDVKFTSVPASYEEWNRREETEAWPHKGNVDFGDLVRGGQ